MLQTKPRKLILASRSPRRQELLRQVGVDFELLDLEIDESVLPGEVPVTYVERMANAKAAAGWELLHSEDSPSNLQENHLPVLAADTSVVCDQHILGKPANPGEAREMLSLLAGRSHQVITSVCLRSEQEVAFMTSISQVTFGPIGEALKDWYCATGEGADKAGGYAIQGLAARFVVTIEGSYSGIVGLPLYETCQLLDKYYGVQ